MKVLRLLLLLPLMSMTRCALEPAPPFTLPAATTEGANTMGLVVNGRTWRSFDGEYGGGIDGNLHGRYNHASGHFELDAWLRAKDISESFDLTLDSLWQPGTYATTYRRESAATLRGTRALMFRANDSDEPYSTQERGSAGSITITRLDTVQRIVSGTFSGNLYRPGTRTKSVSITDGRFDLHYN